MGVLIILLIASISVAATFLAAFLWGVKNKQFDDDFSPPHRILFDDAPTIPPVDASKNPSINN